MMTISGSAALSDFRAEALKQALQKQVSSVKSVAARYEHFVDCEYLGADDEAKFRQLLDYGDEAPDDPTGSLTVLVLPRAGTTSSWSSKATDICRNAGLNSVNRVERGIRYFIQAPKTLSTAQKHKLTAKLHDRMTETTLLPKDEAAALSQLFGEKPARPLIHIPFLRHGATAIEKASAGMGRELTREESKYLAAAYKKLGRDPTDAELMMFSVVNSDHCRHIVFNAEWSVDGTEQGKSLFEMIKHTYQKHSAGIASAYSDNGAVLDGAKGDFFYPDAEGNYQHHAETANIVIKVETHNHPTAIEPTAGAATGSGGEIRDEGATGRGAKPKAGLSGFSVSNLHIEDAELPWETPYGHPAHMATPLEIMLAGPIGGAAFNNEFGRPNILGYFRAYEQALDGVQRGYHKPIMLAGGLANITAANTQKGTVAPGDKLVILGGPAMLIGLGGGSSSSRGLSSASAELDFASVQRHNPEMQRRAQEVINRCSLSDDNPIVSIHDIGAGGYSNAVSELVHDNGLGATIELRAIHNADMSLSPMEIWCNEAQERYVIAIKTERLSDFEQYCQRERCPFTVIGEATEQQQLVVTDSQLGENAINAPMDLFFGKPPRMARSYKSKTASLQALDMSQIKLDEAIERVLKHPTVGNKSFLITIGDRTVGGLVTRDQMVGPWQVPVADVAVTANSFDGYDGEAMAMGERTPLALHDPASSGRMAVGELITNIVAADIAKLSDIKLSANWMAAVNTPGGDQALYETVKAVGLEFCPALGLTIPVGKDSTSMQAKWQEKKRPREVISPLSLIVSGFSPVSDVRTTLTPQLVAGNTTVLVAIPLSENTRLGGSTLAHVFNQTGNRCPDAEPAVLKHFFEQITKLKRHGAILAYHDRSDGGWLATLCEMAFAARTGLDITVGGDDIIRGLFTEELGAVIQIAAKDEAAVLKQFKKAWRIATLNATDTITVSDTKGTEHFSQPRAVLQQWWSYTSYHVARRRDNPESVQREFDGIAADDPGLSPKTTFDTTRRRTKVKQRPRVAILREQGVNGQIEMAAAFDRAGFESADVHMSDLFAGRHNLESFAGLAACGGFSYGDVLGAGGGWAKSVLFNRNIRDQFQAFFERENTFSLGVCNGCQMLANLKELIPGAGGWPDFTRNQSEQFEARLTTVEVVKSPSVLLKDMQGSRLLVPTAHGEGRVTLNTPTNANLSLRFVDNHGEPAEYYPANPNGSTAGATGFTSDDGRATIMMPHPERVFRTVQLSWRPADWTGEDSPWIQLFDNAYQWSRAHA